MDDVIVCDSNMIKRYFSSLFARKMTYLITTTVPRTVVYTTIDPENISVYTQDFDNVIHVVTFDEAVVKALMTKFPIFENTCACIELSKFTTQLNKMKFANAYMEIKGHGVFLGEHTEEGDKLCEEACGRLITELIANYYVEFRTRVEGYYQDSHVTMIDATKAEREGKAWYIWLHDRGIESLHAVKKVRFPYIDGFNGVSLFEFVKKLNADEYKLQIRTWYEGSALRLIVQYEDNRVKIDSIQPDALWFPMDIETFVQKKPVVDTEPEVLSATAEAVDEVANSEP